MRISFKSIILGFFLASIYSPANADFDFLLELGLHEGGDDLVTVGFSDGTNRSIQAGEFISLDAGIAWDWGEVMEARLVGGWKGDEISADNGGIDYSRWTSNFLLMFKAGNWRFGGGATYHWDIELEGSGSAVSASAEFDDALGYIAEVDYYFHEKAFVGLQYTIIEYDRLATLGNSAASFDANSIALVIAGRW